MISDMRAANELTLLKDRLSRQIATLQAELASVDKTLELLARENLALPKSTQSGTRFRNTGLSDAIRETVGPEWISPTEVRDALMAGGYPNSDKSKLLASVFATMKRLGKSVFESKKVDGKLKYRMRPEDPRDSVERAGLLEKRQIGNNGTGVLRKTQIHEWLKNHGPATNKQIVDGTGIPNGTVGGYLSSEGDLFEKRDGQWHARV